MAKVPIGDSAVKVVNAIVKNYGGFKGFRYSPSNPYSKWQVLDVNLTAANIRALKIDLVADGWTLSDGGSWISKGSVTIKFVGSGVVSVTGFKKAKALPGSLWD